MNPFQLSRIFLAFVVAAIVLAIGTVVVAQVSLFEMLVQREKDTLSRSVAVIMEEVQERDADSLTEVIDLARRRARLLSMDVYPGDDLSSAPPAGEITRRNRTLLLSAQSHNGERTLVFERSLGRVDTFVFPATMVFSAMLAVVLTPIIVGGYMAVLGLARRISDIQNGAHRFARGELAHRVSVSYPAELAGLAATLNGMAEQLDQRLKTANQQRRESEVILASMVEGILVLETSLKIRTLNNVAAGLLGTRIDRARGRYLHEITGTGELESFARESVKRQEPMERSLVVDLGKHQHFQVHSSPLEEKGGRARGVLLVLNDITRIKRLEDMRRDFVANVSHELKTPITSIRGFVETLLDDEIEDRNQRQRFLQIVLRHSSRLQAILEDLLSLSRLEQADHTIPRDEVNLHHLTARIHEAVEPQAQEKNMALMPSISGDPLVSVNVNLIEQAIVNLVDNAIKYGKESSEILLRFVHTPENLSIMVTNQGPAIPPESLPRIFERFYRVDKARSRSFGGTGLGLAIVKHIAMAHEGTITVESDEQSGTTFRMELPMHTRSTESSTIPQPRA